MFNRIFTVCFIFALKPLCGDQVKTPNILFAFADDWGRQASIYAKVEGAGGINDMAKTPNFDKLAREGVLFTNASVNAPSCTPCRSALLSGRNFWETGRGAILQGAVWDEKIPTWPLLLRDSGYHIGKTYKVWSPGTPKDAGYGGRAHSFEKAGRNFRVFSQYVSGRMSKGVTMDKAKEELYQEARQNFKSFLDKRKKDQPPRVSPREARLIVNRSIQSGQTLDVLYLAKDGKRVSCSVSPERLAVSPAGDEVMVALDIKKDERRTYKLAQIERMRAVEA